jgi:hypothetical protein
MEHRDKLTGLTQFLFCTARCELLTEIHQLDLKYQRSASGESLVEKIYPKLTL